VCIREELRKALVQSYETELGFAIEDREAVRTKRHPINHRLETELRAAREELSRLREQLKLTLSTLDTMVKVGRGCAACWVTLLCFPVSRRQQKTP
jgi:hypothetical protein